MKAKGKSLAFKMTQIYPNISEIILNKEIHKLKRYFYVTKRCEWIEFELEFVVKLMNILEIKYSKKC